MRTWVAHFTLEHLSKAYRTTQYIHLVEIWRSSPCRYRINFLWISQISLLFSQLIRARRKLWRLKDGWQKLILLQHKLIHMRNNPEMKNRHLKQCLELLIRKLYKCNIKSGKKIWFFSILNILAILQSFYSLTNTNYLTYLTNLF